MTDKELLIEWLKERPCLSINCLERNAGIPDKILAHYINGRRKFPVKHYAGLIPVLRLYGWGNDEKTKKETEKWVKLLEESFKELEQKIEKLKNENTK